MLWADAYKMGCGYALCTSSDPAFASYPSYILVVCDYNPAGNVDGNYVYK